MTHKDRLFTGKEVLSIMVKALERNEENCRKATRVSINKRIGDTVVFGDGLDPFSEEGLEETSLELRADFIGKEKGVE